jgi:hypothetical protein
MNGWRFPFEARPWADIFGDANAMAINHEEFGYLAAVAASVIETQSTEVLAGLTSMHDIIVTSTPVPDAPLDVVAVRAPGLLRSPEAGKVLVEHVAVSGHNDRIERPATEAVPLFWRFIIEKFGVHPVSRSH